MAGTYPRIRYRMRAFKQIRRLEDLQKMEYDFAVKGARAAGDGYVARSADRETRSRAAVITATYGAMRDNARNHTLMGVVIDAMRAP